MDTRRQRPVRRIAEERHQDGRTVIVFNCPQRVEPELIRTMKSCGQVIDARPKYAEKSGRRYMRILFKDKRGAKKAVDSLNQTRVSDPDGNRWTIDVRLKDAQHSRPAKLLGIKGWGGGDVDCKMTPPVATLAVTIEPQKATETKMVDEEAAKSRDEMDLSPLVALSASAPPVGKAAVEETKEKKEESVTLPVSTSVPLFPLAVARDMEKDQLALFGRWREEYNSATDILLTHLQPLLSTLSVDMGSPGFAPRITIPSVGGAVDKLAWRRFSSVKMIERIRKDQHSLMDRWTATHGRILAMMAAVFLKPFFDFLKQPIT